MYDIPRLKYPRLSHPSSSSLGNVTRQFGVIVARQPYVDALTTNQLAFCDGAFTINRTNQFDVLSNNTAMTSAMQVDEDSVVDAGLNREVGGIAVETPTVHGYTVIRFELL